MVKNLMLVSALLVSLVAGLGLGYGLANPTQYERRIADLETEITELNTQVIVLMGEISELEHELKMEILGVYFSPKGGCEDQVLYWIDRANVSIHILIYSFTLDSISGKLIEAHQRGVEVRVVFEKQQVTEYSEYSILKAAGISVRNDTNPDYMHHKVMIIDGILILTGSFNYSAHAEEENNENLIVIESTYVAGIYEDEFQKIWSSSI